MDIIAYLIGLFAHVYDVLITWATNNPTLAIAIGAGFLAAVVADEIRIDRRQRAQRATATPKDTTP